MVGAASLVTANQKSLVGDETPANGAALLIVWAPTVTFTSLITKVKLAEPTRSQALVVGQRATKTEYKVPLANVL